MTLVTQEVRLMTQAARELARDEVLGPDPTSDNILLAAAELAEGCESVDLLRLSEDDRQKIIDAYDKEAAWDEQRQDAAVRAAGGTDRHGRYDWR